MNISSKQLFKQNQQIVIKKIKLCYLKVGNFLCFTKYLLYIVAQKHFFVKLLKM